MVAAIQEAAFPAELARRLVVAMVQNPKIQTLRKMLGLEDDDIISAGVSYAFEQWGQGKYDPAKAQIQTFIQQRANSGIYNLLRKEGVQDRIERRVGGELHKPDKDRELCDWLKDVFEAAKRMYISKRHNQGRRAHTAPQLVAIASLMQREGLSCRGCARLLAQRQDLQAVLRIKQLPSYRWIWEASKLLKVVTERASMDGEVVTENN